MNVGRVRSPDPHEFQLVVLMPVLAASHLIYVFSVVLHCISIHVVANKILPLQDLVSK